MEHFRKLIKEMVSHDSTHRPSFEKIVQQIKNYVDHKEIKENKIIIKVCDKIKLGQGGYGIVLYGTLTNKQEKPKKKSSVAVKRIDVASSAINPREEESMKELNHKNVIRLFHAVSDSYYRYSWYTFSKKT